ncbi:hypothetical protein A5658_25330 [Mycobacterium sp. 1245111.1]|uniref:hypothetical protein n=1 Tax=Mycobacterium sp. 1245111.1 TaxID=1834073 RepID=UPI000800AFCB|nr:hypothetical protein A5658_25330 [Mycobacterium sp. 1245111.1]
MTEKVEVRPELVSLVPVDRDRVAELVAAKGGHCESCDGTDFEVGRALYLGFLFLDEDIDAYMVALTCRNPECGRHTGIRLREKEFLTRGESEARAATWLASAPSGARPRG